MGVAAAEKQAADPVARRDCIRKGLIFHVFVVVALLALLWVVYIALKLLGNDEEDDYSYHYAEYYYRRRWNNYPWSLTLQLIATLALLQSVVAHYVSVLPCQKRTHWSVIVIGNVVNVLVFLWLMWLIIAITTPSGGSAVWLLLVTVLVGVAGCISAAALWIFCSQQPRPCEQQHVAGAAPVVGVPVTRSAAEPQPSAPACGQP